MPVVFDRFTTVKCKDCEVLWSKATGGSKCWVCGKDVLMIPVDRQPVFELAPKPDARA